MVSLHFEGTIIAFSAVEFERKWSKNAVNFRQGKPKELCHHLHVQL